VECSNDFARTLSPPKPARQFGELAAKGFVFVLKAGLGVNEGSLQMYEAIANRALKAASFRSGQIGILRQVG
jgi:hypothetical protein